MILVKSQKHTGQKSKAYWSKVKSILVKSQKHTGQKLKPDGTFDQYARHI